MLKTRKQAPHLFYPHGDTVRILNSQKPSVSVPGPRVGFNFRSTLGYIADGPGETFIGPSLVYSGGLGYGWDATLGANARDRSLAYGVRLAGIHYTGAARFFRYDLPDGPGLYRVWAGIFDTTGGNAGNWDIRDGTSLIQAIRGFAGVTGLDATNATITATDWNTLDGGNYLDHDFTDSYCSVICAALGGNHSIAHLGFQKL